MESKNFSPVQSIFSFQSLLYSSVRRIFLKIWLRFSDRTLFIILEGAFDMRLPKEKGERRKRRC